MAFAYSESDTNKIITPKEPGWYIAYSTESGDDSAIGPLQLDKPITCEDEAMKKLKEIVTWEWEGGKFYACPTGWGKIK